MAKNEKKYTLSVSLDLQATYDSIYIDGLIFKYAQVGITGRILRWLHRFLSGKSINMAWRSFTSSARIIGKGIPHGGGFNSYSLHHFFFFGRL